MLTSMVVALVALLLASTAAAVLLRNQQVRAAERSLALLAQNVAARYRLVVREGENPNQLLRRFAAQEGIRFLVVGPQGSILHDSEDRLVGERIPDVERLLGRPQGRDGQGQFRTVRLQVGGEDLLVAPLPVPPGLRPQVSGELALILLAVPTASLLSTWVQLLPPLVVVALLALGVAAGVAWYMARRISRPLVEMTEAARRMAKGDYDIRVTVEDGDELADLCEAFNTMAEETKVARHTQRNFLASVSHDLRTPLTSIQGFSQALIDGTVRTAEQRQRVAQIIHDEASRLARLVQHLLDLARIESGRFAMAHEEVDLNAMLAQVQERYTALAEAQGVNFVVRRPRKSLPMIGDAARLEQVLTNLLDNAFHYARMGNSGQPKVQLIGKLGGVRGVGSAQGGGELGRWWIEVIVKDNGPGISAEDLPHIFDRFYRGDISHPSGSVGLGLAITREIVQAHGGEILVESGEHGTTFTVRLPMNLGHEATGRAALLRMGLTQSTPPKPNGQRRGPSTKAK
ncbi:MAG: HAMP domain-containing sensor histidine kinase [Ardenticatenia bacterium]|nr:HAMP domain-containing sensor histidine kinase [Ardenticatenia bacterium]